MLGDVKEYIASKLKRGEGSSNLEITTKQKRLLKGMLIILLIFGAGLVAVVQDKLGEVESEEGEFISKADLTHRIDLPDKGLDTEKHWREHFEDERAKEKAEFDARLKAMEEAQERLLSKAKNSVDNELLATKEKLEMAKRELADAALELKRVSGEEKERLAKGPMHIESALNIQEFATGVEYDLPKSAANYVPEGTYFTGHLLGGIMVSTALSTPDENATPVSIELLGRYSGRKATTNLSKMNKLPLQHCRIMGSAYGDLSSERAIIRLEKMICLENDTYITSKIAGQIYGPDGMNGIKGSVVSTSSKHLKNALIGGMISGLSGASKGQEGISVGGGGVLSTKSRGAKEMLGAGALTGVSNAGDKLADYYLRQAEAMSPVLIIPAGVRVNAQITKGFFVGEIGTHKRIKQAKK